MSVESEAEEAFHAAWLEHGLDGATITREHAFRHGRRWRADFAIEATEELKQTRAHATYGIRYLIEIEGHGRHQTVVGFRNDCEKYNAAAALGWRVLRFPASIVTKDPEGVVDEVNQLICGHVPESSLMKP